MAPSLLEDKPTTTILPAHHEQLPKDADWKIFHDGIKTSGQHPPIYDLLKPYSEFPKEITGSTVWRSEDYIGRPERWVHYFNEEEIAELGNAADNFIAQKFPLTGISKDNFPLPNLSPLLSSIRSEILNGKGFILFKNFPVEKWGLEKSAVAYMGLGTRFGYLVSQNGRGHVLGHVKDLGDDPTQIDKVRIYRTNARQFFHADDADLVGLLCIEKAARGGESDIVSMHHVYNILQQERPDVIETLTKPIWFFDRKGETSNGEDEYIRTSVLYIETGPNGRVYSKWDPYYVKSLTRFSNTGEIPPLSVEQKEALQVLEETCQRQSLHMTLERGDLQLLNNSHILHARTEYEDNLPPQKPRHLMRLWLATPEGEGGWKLPFHDSTQKKRGGIQVNNQPPVCPLDAE